MDIHKECYSAIDLTRQDGPHRRETRFAPELGHRSTRLVLRFCANNRRKRLQQILFYQVVSGGEQRWRHHNSERLCGLEIDGEIELGRLHHW
jgi:hypothetical protein